MSTLEKKIYAEITVPGNKKIEAVISRCSETCTATKSSGPFELILSEI